MHKLSFHSRLFHSALSFVMLNKSSQWFCPDAVHNYTHRGSILDIQVMSLCHVHTNYIEAS